MSQRIIPVFLLAGFLAGCGGNPFAAGDLGGTEPEDPGGSVPGPGTGGGTPPTTPSALLPGGISGAVVTSDLAGFVPGAANFAIQMTAQDAAGLSGNYVRDAALDVGPYQAFTYQETTANRKVVALVRKVGGAAGMVAMDAGQFSNSNYGGQAWRADTFVKPTAPNGVGPRFIYSGTYAGLLNAGSPTPGGTPGIFNPTQAFRTTGRALITADFTEMNVTGGVDLRSVVDPGGAALNPLPDLALTATGITADGTFSGGIMRLDPTWTAAGTVGGAFSGDASELVAVMVFNPTTAPDLFEQGVMVLPSCASAGGPACP